MADFDTLGVVTNCTEPSQSCQDWEFDHISTVPFYMLMLAGFFLILAFFVKFKKRSTVQTTVIKQNRYPHNPNIRSPPPAYSI
jgi:hypothetical protein